MFSVLHFSYHLPYMHRIRLLQTTFHFFAPLVLLSFLLFVVGKPNIICYRLAFVRQRAIVCLLCITSCSTGNIVVILTLEDVSRYKISAESFWLLSVSTEVSPSDREVDMFIKFVSFIHNLFNNTAHFRPRHFASPWVYVTSGN